jgi:hypothetical protein
MPYAGKDLYILGELTGYGKDPDALLTYYPEKKAYETTLFLKQGYYDYEYATREKNRPDLPFLTDLTENNSWETENIYFILVYFRELGGRYDQLVGFSRISSQFNRAGNY